MRADVAATSGGLRVSAGRITGLRVDSVSGRVRITGLFSTEGRHEVRSLSGDVMIEALSGATMVGRTISGRLVPGDGPQPDPRLGQGALPVGGGGAVVRVRTVSGEIALRPSGAPARTRGRRPTTQDPVQEAREALARGDISIDEADRRITVLHG